MVIDVTDIAVLISIAESGVLDDLGKSINRRDMNKKITEPYQLRKLSFRN